MHDVTGSLDPNETTMTPFEKAERNLASFADRVLFSYQLHELMEMLKSLKIVSKINAGDERLDANDPNHLRLIKDLRNEKIEDEIQSVELAIEMLLASYQYNILEV
tara:strand:+ start:565 stop:882 length:318 start_codon:yes stop_codon:yes gene_type:complete